MVLVDANVLLYAVNQSLPHHPSAKRWMEAALNGDEQVGFSWQVLLAFIRVVTLRSVIPEPLVVADAIAAVEAWLDAEPATIVAPTARHLEVLGALLQGAGTGGNLVSDAHLAALAIEHAARICTFDRDFARFEGVTSFSPA